MDYSNGWISLHRNIEDNFLWFLEPFTKAQAWIDLLLNANYQDNTINIRGNVVHLKRGQLGWSELTMCKRWRWSKNKVRRFLKLLETKQQIVQQKDRFITTIITVLNYDKWQMGQQTIQQTIQQKDSRRYIANKDNKDNKGEGNGKVKYLDFVYLTSQEHDLLKTSWGESNLKHYIERMNDYIGSKGVKYKSHYHALKAWYRKDHPGEVEDNRPGYLKRDL